MLLSPTISDVSSTYQSSLCELTQAIEWGQGHFSLILAHCNTPKIRDRALNDLRHYGTFPLRMVSLRPDAELMFSAIARGVKPETGTPDQSGQPLEPYSSSYTASYTSNLVLPESVDREVDREADDEINHGAIAIAGFETVTNIDALLASADTVRDELRKVFHCPLVWWVNDTILIKLIRLAPNIHSWFTFVEFLNEPETIATPPSSWTTAPLVPSPSHHEAMMYTPV